MIEKLDKVINAAKKDNFPPKKKLDRLGYGV